MHGPAQALELSELNESREQSLQQAADAGVDIMDVEVEIAAVQEELDRLSQRAADKALVASALDSVSAEADVAVAEAEAELAAVQVAGERLKVVAANFIEKLAAVRAEGVSIVGATNALNASHLAESEAPREDMSTEQQPGVAAVAAGEGASKDAAAPLESQSG